MTRSEMVLAALAAAGQNATFTPVQVQKLFFLLDKEAAHLLGGPYFQFAPHDYGPFDRAVYDELDGLAKNDLTIVQSTGRYRVYGLSQEGFQEGSKALDKFSGNAKSYVSDVANWVRRLTFEQLVASIYNRYPDMKVNSVFRG
ncbi:hypothetical protein [Bradyrhizobium sp. LB11.1]|uniref:hypothetical protein n=1 Tax=Bradyrhizobium sp. LB11.1 TaxID=3156326 RepID=UPI003394A431